MQLPSLHPVELLQKAPWLFTAVVVTALALVYLYTSNGPAIPSVPIREYLRGGDVLRILVSPSSIIKSMDSLSLKYGDIFYVRLGVRPLIVSSNPKDIIFLAGPSPQIERPTFIAETFKVVAPGGLFTMDRERHRVMKATLRKNFNHTMLDGFHDQILLAVSELCDTLTTDARSQTTITDISRQLAITTFRVIVNVAFGFSMDREERMHFAQVLDGLMNQVMIEFMQYPFRQLFVPFGIRKRLNEGKRQLFAHTSRFISRRLEEPAVDAAKRPRDLLDILLSVEGLSSEAVPSMILEFSAAGSHTTSQMLAWAIYEICQRPHVAQRLYNELDTKLAHLKLEEQVSKEDLDELSYINNVWKETLRLHPVSGGVTRKITEDLVLPGSNTFVAKGYYVFAHRSRTHTHMKYWENPNTFDPDRWETLARRGARDEIPIGAYLPFGFGPRNCVGTFLADHEGMIILVELFRRFQFELAVPPDQVVEHVLVANTPKSRSRPDGPFDRGVPVRVSLRH